MAKMTEFNVVVKMTGKITKIDFGVVEIKINYVNSRQRK